MKSSVRIVVLGDEGVGKTSIISSFLKEEFDPQVPDCLPEISIPAELTVDKVHTYIVDTKYPGRDNYLTDILYQQVSFADAVCLVVSMHNLNDGLDRLRSYWLPYLRRQVPGIPVLLVINKVDLQDSDASLNVIEDFVNPFMTENREIETSLECSARELLNVAEVFFYASKAVLHPTAPIYDTRLHSMTDAANSALSRIFKLCDTDNDGLLSDQELNAFQNDVFGSPLQHQELEGIKDIVKQECPDGIKNNCLTKNGFIFLHLLFVKKGRMETLWTVLRSFGYDDQVRLRNDFLYPYIGVTKDDATELSPKGYQFFADLFQSFDKDNDGALNAEELTNLFATAPKLPWKRPEMSAITNEEGNLTLQGFLALWSMTTLLDIRKTLSYLAYLGYTEKADSAIKVIKKSQASKNRSSRTVFRALVIGAMGCGKSEFLKRHVDKPFSPTYTPNSPALKVINSVESRGEEKYLVLEEVDVSDCKRVLTDKELMKQVDVLCFAYDVNDPNSFGFLTKLRSRFDLDKYPVVYMAMKTDLEEVYQSFDPQPANYIQSLGLAPALQVSMNRDPTETSAFYNYIIGVALNPQVATIAGSKANRPWILVAGVGIAASLLGAAAYVAVKYLRKAPNKTQTTNPPTTNIDSI